MDIKLIALDLDDTTLRSDSTLSDETLAALKMTAEAGIELVAASGRAYSSLPKSILALPNLSYAITSNGSSVYRCSDGARLISRCIPESSVREILSAFPEGTLYECFIDGQPYCERSYMEDPAAFGCSTAYVEYVKTTRLPVDGIRRFILANADRLDALDIICPNAEIKKCVYERSLQFERVYVTSSSPRLVEFASPEAGKGKALRELCALLGIAEDNCAAFGNGDNDADMLECAGLGVAVANATAGCRAAADLVCDSNNDNGVAQTVMEIILNML